MFDLSNLISYYGEFSNITKLTQSTILEFGRKTDSS